MNKRTKKIIAALTALAAAYFLLTGASWLFLKTYVFPALESYRLAGAYPYSDHAVPGDFAAYSAAGIRLWAPDGLTAEISPDAGTFTSSGDAQCDLRITVVSQQSSIYDDMEYIRERPNLLSKWITGRGWLTRLGMKQIGYRIPESKNELLYLLEKADQADYHKLSLTEAYAFTKLAVLKAIFLPAMIGDEKNDAEHPLAEPLETEDCGYYCEKDQLHAIIRQSCSSGGRYRLAVTCYPDSDTDPVKLILILSDDPVTAQTIAASIRPA